MYGGSDPPAAMDRAAPRTCSRVIAILLPFQVNVLCNTFTYYVYSVIVKAVGRPENSEGEREKVENPNFRAFLRPTREKMTGGRRLFVVRTDRATHSARSFFKFSF